VFERMGQWDRAISDLTLSSQYANQLSYWRGLTQVDGLLAKAYLHQGALQPCNESTLGSIIATAEGAEYKPEAPFQGINIGLLEAGSKAVVCGEGACGHDFSRKVSAEIYRCEAVKK
jgi:hypothetical protein